MSKAKQPQGFNEISDHVSNDGDRQSPIIKSKTLPLSSKDQSAIMDNTKNIRTSTPNRNLHEWMINIVIGGNAITIQCDSTENVNALPTKTIANVDGPIQIKVSIRTLMKELQNEKKLVTIDSEDDSSSNEIEDTRKTESVEGHFFGIKEQYDKMKTQKLKKVKASNDQGLNNGTDDDEVIVKEKLRGNQSEICKMNGKDIKIHANLTDLKQKQNNIIESHVKASIKEVAGAQLNTRRAIVLNFEEQDTYYENYVQDIQIKEIETNANSTGVIKEGRNYQKGQRIMSNKPKASTSKVDHIGFDEQGCTWNEIEDTEVNSAENLNLIVASTSQKRTKASENKQLKKKSSKKNTAVAAKAQNFPNEIDDDAINPEENKITANVASTSKKRPKSVEKNTNTASKRKLKDTPIAVELEDNSIAQKKLKLIEVATSVCDSTISTDDEIDEQNKNSSKFDRDFSLHNGDISSVKRKESVYDKGLQRLCDELNASRKSYDFPSFGNSTLNDSVRRSGRSRKPPKLRGLMYIQPIDSSTSGKKSKTPKTLQRPRDQGNDDINERNVQVNDQIASQNIEKKTKLCTKQTSSLKSSRNMSKLHIKSKTSQNSAKEKETSEEDNFDSSRDNNECTAESQI